MKNISLELKEKINKADELFEKKYFEEALFEYKNIFYNIPLKDIKVTDETKLHFLEILKKKSSCIKELKIYTESIEVYIKIIYFLDKNFTMEEKIEFIKEYYEHISQSIIEAYLESDVLEKNMHFRPALFMRQKALRLVDLIFINIGDLLFYKSPYEFIKQANLSKLLGQIPNAEKFFLLAIENAKKFLATDPDFFNIYLEDAYGELILFYEDFDELKKLDRTLDEYIQYSEERYNKGENILFETLANAIVKKALLNEDHPTKYKLFNKALSYYKELKLESLRDKTYYYISYLEINMELSIGKEENIKSLEEFCEFFLKKSHSNCCNYYYLLTLKNLLIAYFHKQQLIKILKISKNIHINKDKLNNKELEIYKLIELFLNSCNLFLEFQKSIYYRNTEKYDKNARECYKNTLYLWNKNFISKKDFLFINYTFANLYRHTIRNDTQSLFYFREISHFYSEEDQSESIQNIFANTFLELGLYYMEAGEFQESLSYLSKSIQLFKDLYKISKKKYKLNLHKSLLERAVLSYNFFNNYESFTHCINEAIFYLKDSIDNWKDLYELFKTLELKAKVLEEREEVSLLFDTYKEFYSLYKLYNFDYSYKLNKIYKKNLEAALVLYEKNEKKELEDFFVREFKKIKEAF